LNRISKVGAALAVVPSGAPLVLLSLPVPPPAVPDEELLQREKKTPPVKSSAIRMLILLIRIWGLVMNDGGYRISNLY
jgi:hypothetical protein